MPVPYYAVHSIAQVAQAGIAMGAAEAGAAGQMGGPSVIWRTQNWGQRMDNEAGALDLSGIDFDSIDFDGLEIVTIADGLAMPEMGASVSTCSCGSSSSCCSCYSCWSLNSAE